MDMPLLPRGRLKSSVVEALEAATAYKLHHEQWFEFLQWAVEVCTRNHRGSTARFKAKMQKLNRAIDGARAQQL